MSFYFFFSELPFVSANISARISLFVCSNSEIRRATQKHTQIEIVVAFRKISTHRTRCKRWRNPIYDHDIHVSRENWQSNGPIQKSIPNKYIFEENRLENKAKNYQLINCLPPFIRLLLLPLLSVYVRTLQTIYNTVQLVHCHILLFFSRFVHAVIYSLVSLF